MVPPCPVHLAATSADDGVDLSWTRRSRLGWRWIDGIDAPLGEETERYRVTIAPDDGPERTEETTARLIHLSAGDLPALASVRQVGACGLSPPATIRLGDS